MFFFGGKVLRILARAGHQNRSSVEGGVMCVMLVPSHEADGARNRLPVAWGLWNMLSTGIWHKMPFLFFVPDFLTLSKREQWENINSDFCF